MTRRKRWPNEAENARLDALALAKKISQQVMPMVAAIEEGKIVSALELSVRLIRINAAAKDIELKLLQAGPTTFLE